MVNSGQDTGPYGKNHWAGHAIPAARLLVPAVPRAESRGRKREEPI